jgi:hypothetical protein
MNHPLSSPRGIQYEDVAQAADALLHEGLRPTIERIRQRIGRGSPNTVSPMLERWFAGLGQRLQGSATAPEQADGLPPVLWQAVQDGWLQACQQAEQQAAAAYRADHEALAQQAQQLEQDRAQMNAHETALNERLRALEESLQLCTQQLHESNERWKASQRSLAQRETEMSAQQGLFERLSAQHAALQQRLEEVQTQAQLERQQLQEHYQQNERRWMTEVDRARQQNKQLSQQFEQQLQAQERQNIQAQTQLEQQLATQQQQAQQQVQQQQTQIAHLQQQLALAQGQASQATLLLTQWQSQPAAGTPVKEQAPERKRPSLRPALRRSAVFTKRLQRGI